MPIQMGEVSAEDRVAGGDCHPGGLGGFRHVGHGADAVGVSIFGVVSCLIPCFLIYKVPALRYLKSPKVWFVIFFGILLVIWSARF